MKALLRCWTGPTGVAEVAVKMREAGLTVTTEGTEHVYVESEGMTADGACWNLLVDLRREHGMDMGLRPTFCRWLRPAEPATEES